MRRNLGVSRDRLSEEFSKNDLRYLQKQAANMEWDTFPLDRQLPLGTVWKIFKDEYEKVHKTAQELSFFGNTYKRLREGYFALFVAVAKVRLEDKEHYLSFPKDPSCDAHILSVKEVVHKRPTLWRFPCDVKEFTRHSDSFLEFIEDKIVPRLERKNYNVIVGIHVDIPDLHPAIDLLKLQTQNQTVWLVSSTNACGGSDFSKGRVIMVFGNIVRYMDIDLSTEIPQIKKGQPILIYQNTLRDKMK